MLMRQAIISERLELVPPILTPSPVLAMVGWLNDPEVVVYSEQRHKTHTVDSQLEYIHSFGITDNFRMIVAKDQFIGTISAQIDKPNLVANVGILIGEKSEWGKGYGTEAWTAFCNHLFKRGIRKIEAGCMSVNVGMMEVCRKYGMAREGNVPEHFLFKGIPCSMLMWGKFA